MITNFKIYEESSHSLKRVYENVNKKQIFIIPLEMPCFKICLEKLGMSKKEIERWMNNYKNKVLTEFTDYGQYPLRKTITISREKYISRIDYSYTWYWYPGGQNNEYQEFMGKLDCTPEEIEEYLDNIEREENIKKYNL